MISIESRWLFFALLSVLGLGSLPVSAATVLDFTNSVATPDLDGDAGGSGIRYNDVAAGIDAVIFATTTYSGIGGSSTGSFARINQGVNSTTLYEMSLYDADTTDLIDATGLTLDLIILDIDGLTNLGVPREAITFFTPATFQLTTTTQVDVHHVPGGTRFLSNNSASNATNPSAGTTDLSDLQEDHSVLLTFENQNRIVFDLASNVGGGGRNFLIDGGALSFDQPTIDGIIAIPEPTRVALAAIGITLMAIRRRR